MNIRKIVLFEATGKVGQRLMEEALNRGHEVTAIMRYGAGFKAKRPNLKAIVADIRTKEDISRQSEGHDMVIYAHEPVKEKPGRYIDITRALIEGTKAAGVERVISIGHTFAYPMENTQEFYDEWKPVARAQRQALSLFRNEANLDWAYIHSIEPEFDQSTGRYLISNEAAYTTRLNESRIPINGYAPALFNIIGNSEYEMKKYEYGYEMSIEN